MLRLPPASNSREQAVTQQSRLTESTKRQIKDAIKRATDLGRTNTKVTCDYFTDEIKTFVKSQGYRVTPTYNKATDTISVYISW